MPLKNTLTSEHLNQRFENPFALVNYAIGLAKVRVHRGEGLDSNPANDVLELIAKGQDTIEDEEEKEGSKGEEIVVIEVETV